MVAECCAVPPPLPWAWTNHPLQPRCRDSWPCSRAASQAHLLASSQLLGSSHGLGHRRLTLGSILGLALPRRCRLASSCSAGIGRSSMSQSAQQDGSDGPQQRLLQLFGRPGPVGSLSTRFFGFRPLAAAGGGGTWRHCLLTLLSLCQCGLARLLDCSGQLFFQSVFQAASHLLQLVDRGQQPGLGRQGQLLRL